MHIYAYVQYHWPRTLGCILHAGWSVPPKIVSWTLISTQIVNYYCERLNNYYNAVEGWGGGWLVTGFGV